MEWKIFVVMIVTILIIGCGTDSVKEPASESPEKVVPKVEDKVVKSVKVEESPKAMEKIEESVVESKLAALIKKGKETASYYYYFKSRKLNSFDNYDEDFYEVYFKGDKERKVYGKPKKITVLDYFTEVYLDSTEKSAIGVCVKPGVKCNPILTNAYKVDYDIEKLRITPRSVLEDLSYSITEVGTEVINSRKAIVLEYMDGDKKVVLSVDSFYGLPMKRLVYEVGDEDDILLEETNFEIINVGSIKNADVSLPDTYKMVE